MTVRKKMAVVVGVLAVMAGAGYLALSPPVASPLYEHYVFEPKKFPLGYYHSQENLKLNPEDIWLTSRDGTRLHCWLFSNPQAEKVVLFVHGKGGNLSYRAAEIEQLIKSGLSVLIFDYRGYGKSEGEPHLEGVYDDVRAAYDYLTRNWEPENIILLGESLGSAFACKLSTQAEHGGIILYAPFTSLREIGKEYMPFTRIYPVAIFPSPDMDNVDVLKRPHKPLLIIHGGADPVVDVHHSRDIYRQAAEPRKLLIVPEAGHVKCARVAPDDFRNAVVEFLSGL